MFYCLLIYSDNLYFIEELEALVIMTNHEGLVELIGVFSEQSFSIDDLLPHIIDSVTTEISLGFMPTNQDSFEVMTRQSDDVLYVLDDVNNLCDRDTLLMPLLSHA